MILRAGNRLLAPGANVQSGRAVVGGGGDWWDYPGVVAAYDAKNASSLANSYVNLANPGTYDAAPGVAPTWAGGTGWTFNGNTQYLKTGVIPLARDWTHAIRVSVPSPLGGYVYGSHSVTGILISPKFSVDTDRLQVWSTESATNIFGLTISDDVWVVSGSNIYQNGSSIGTAPGTSAPASLEIYLGAWNQAGARGGSKSHTFVSCAIYNIMLSSGDVAALSAAMAAL